jgi:hypothetical protein
VKQELNIMKRTYLKNEVAVIGVSLVLAAAFAACSPKVYIIDRQTVLEEEAAGEWPDFETQSLQHSEASTPAPLAKTPVTESKERLYRVLNGDVVTGAR